MVEDTCMGRDNKVRSVWLRLPIAASQIDNKGRPKTQHKFVRRDIEQVSLLEAAFEETTNQNEEQNHQNNDNNNNINDSILPTQ